MAGFLTDLTTGEGAVRVTVGMGRWGSAFAGTTVTVCRKYRRIEAEAGREIQLQERHMKSGCNRVTIGGFGPNTKSVLRKGDRIGIEIREPLDAVVATKRRYFLNVLVAAHLLTASEGSEGTNAAIAREISNGLWAPAAPIRGCGTTPAGRPQAGQVHSAPGARSVR